MAMRTMARTRRKDLRESMGIPQEDLARAANVRLSTYRNAENGNNCSFTTASRILEAFNKQREAHQLGKVGLDDLGLSIV